MADLRVHDSETDKIVRQAESTETIAPQQLVLLTDEARANALCEMPMSQVP